MIKILTEISKQKLANYIKKAKTDVVKKQRGVSSYDEYGGSEINDNDEYLKVSDKIPKRLQNIDKAVDKIIKEAMDRLSKKEILTESAYNLYHTQYTHAINHAFEHHEKTSGIKVKDEDRDKHIAMGPRKPAEGETVSHNIPAFDKNGKEHRIHIQIYNKGGSKPFELNTYSNKMPYQKKKLTEASKHAGTAAKIANLHFQKPEYHEDEDGYRIRKWRQGEEDSKENVHHWLKGNRVVDLKSGLEHVKHSTIQKMIADKHLKKDPHANYYWVTREAQHEYKLDSKDIMGKKYPLHKDIPDPPQKHSNTNTDSYSAHAVAAYKANKLKEPVHVLQDKEGNLITYRHSVWKTMSDKSKTNYKHIRTHHPDK